MSKLRVEYDTISAMELDDEINDDLQIESGMELLKEEIPEIEEDEDGTTKSAKVGLKKKTGSEKVYRDYGDLQIEAFLDLLNNGISTPAAAEQLEITKTSAYGFREKLMKTGKVVRRKPGPSTGTVSPLTQEHTVFVIKFIDKFATTTIKHVKDALMNEFENLSISKSAVHKHMKTFCALSMKRLEKIPEKRNAKETVRLRKERVQQFLYDKEMDFEKNCVFLDEAGFNLHIVLYRGWSAKGQPAKTIVPTERYTSITILGAISSVGVIDISLRKPISISATKKRKALGGKQVKVTKGANTDHYMAYLSNVMDVLDRNNLKGFYLVIDNAPIHGSKGKKVRDYVVSRGYKRVYLPPYSLFFNPIEEFWSKVKSGIKRTPVDGKYTLTPRY